MIERYEETPKALETAIAEARGGQTQRAILVFHRDLNGVHLASLVVRVGVRWFENTLEVEVGMPNRTGNPFRLAWSSSVDQDLIALVASRIDQIVTA
jgi:hypothetical protein